MDELFVNSACQNQGIESTLLQRGEEYCKANGLAGLTLLTNRHMPSKSFYEKNGYTLAEHVIYFYEEV